MSIRFESVSKAFGEKIILSNVSFEVPKGEILFVLGKSGMGKSVTLKHMIGVMKPDQGSVWVDQHNVTTTHEEDLYKIRQTCGMVFQHPALIDSLTIFDNIAFGMRTQQYAEKIGRKVTDVEITDRVFELLNLVHLPEHILPLKPYEVSYGMQKRVSMARTLAPQPDYVLFDEPTTGLDPVSTTSINMLIQELSQTLNVTSVVVSHDMGCALTIAHRILFLDQGKILICDTPKNVAKFDHPTIQGFFNETLGLLTPQERAKWV